MIADRGFAFAGGSVDVWSSDAALAEWLAEFLSPAFEGCTPGSAPRMVVIRRGDPRYRVIAASRPDGVLATAPCFVRDGKVTRRSVWSFQGRTVVDENRLGAFYVVAAAEVEVLLPPGGPRPRTAAMRVVRELATAAALVDPERVLLHAAGLVHGGRAVLFAGPRTCGKTTMLAYVARMAGAPILANDRVLLSADAPTWDARGIPTIVSLRRGTFDLVPDLGRRLPAVAVPVELTRAEAAAVGGPCAPPESDGRLKVSPAQLAHALETSLAAHAPLAAIVFPDPRGDAAAVTITELTPALARERLAGARFGLGARADEPVVFTRHVAARSADADDALLDRLAVDVPCFGVHVGARAFHDPAAAMRVLGAVLR